MLVPLRLDDAVIDADRAWAATLRQRHIADFTRWNQHEQYQQAFERLLHDLEIDYPVPSEVS